MVVLSELVKELKTLRKGRGLYAGHIGERVGSLLREVCDVAEEDGPVIIRQKVCRRLETLAASLPADLRVAVLAAFAICPEARLPLYQERVSWAATRLNRDPRTVRRRIDEGIDHLAQLATVSSVADSDQDPQAAPGGTAPETGWHTTDLRVMLALDRPRPEALEQRRIVSDQDDLAELDLAVTLAMPPAHRGFDIAVFHGGMVLDRGMESSERHAFTLALPQALTKGETHDYAVLFRLPEDHGMRPHLVCVPKRPCELFDLRVRFDRERVPPQIWVLCGAFQRDIRDPVRNGETRAPDAAGEIQLTFRDLTPGLAYGIRWDQ